MDSTASWLSTICDAPVLVLCLPGNPVHRELRISATVPKGESKDRTGRALLGVAQAWLRSFDPQAGKPQTAPLLPIWGQTPQPLNKSFSFGALGSLLPRGVSSSSDAEGGAASSSSALGRLSKEEKEYVGTLSAPELRALCSAADDLLSRRIDSKRSIPLRFRVMCSALPAEAKQRINSKLERLSESSAQSSEASKYAAWVESCLSVPFGEIARPPTLGAEGLTGHLAWCRRQLDTVVHGHKNAKQAVLERVFAWHTNPCAAQRPLAFCGSPGNGKTTLAKHGLGPLLGRPVNFVSLGGAHDCSTLVGHGYTFEASQPGRIVECLESSGCMNPVIYFDELDKVSDTPKGEEITNTLVHLTDTTQNDAFRDRFLNGLDLDLSGALLVFSFNDATKVPRVLLERMQVVQMEPFSRSAQKEVVRSFLFVKAMKRAGVSPGSVVLSDEAEDVLLDKIDAKTGLRGALDVLDQLVTKAGIWREVQDESLIYPLRPSDLKAVVGSERSYVLLGSAVLAVCAQMPEATGGIGAAAASMYS